jgi:hypothetical protein
MKKLLLISWLTASALSIRAQTCDCKAALEYTVQKIETNYAGFRDKVTPANRSAYAAFTDSLRGIAAIPAYSQQDSCYKVLQRWIGFFRDGHINIGITSTAGGPAALPPDSIRAKFASWPVVKHTVANFAAYLARNAKRLQPLEGIWQNEAGSYRVGILYEKGKYTAFILQADSVYWMPGQLKFEMTQEKDGIKGTFYMRDHTAQPVVYTILSLKDGILETGNMGTWFKLDASNQFVFKGYYPGSGIVSFKALSPSTNLLTIKSFDENYRKIIDSIITANDKLIRSTENLVIDVRGNGGGSDFTYYPLRKYLFTHPYTRYGMDIYATNDNIDKFRGLVTNPNLKKEEQEAYKARVAEMEKHLGEYWSMTSSATFMSDTLEIMDYPKKVAVLIDKGCGSTTEQFLLDPVSNSRKATVYGQPSAGVLDYANLYFFTIPNTNFRVNYATSRSKRVDLGKGIDNKGIQPHVLLDTSVKDWVRYAQQQLEK